MLRDYMKSNINGSARIVYSYIWNLYERLKTTYIYAHKRKKRLYKKNINIHNYGDLKNITYVVSYPVARSVTVVNQQ